VRVVVLCSSPYSETGCAMAAHLAQAGHSVAGALTLPTFDRGTLVRKLAQWGPRESGRYAWTKLAARETAYQRSIRNPYLETFLSHEGKTLRNLQEAGAAHNFPVFVCRDQNSLEAIAQLRQWAPDAAVFTGGNILRQPLLAIPRFGVLNAHLALLPQIRGMSSPEWSLLSDVPLGISIHLMDTGIDTGPILVQQQFELPPQCDSLMDLRNRMIAGGIGLIAHALAGLEDGSIRPKPQPDVDRDRQYFVAHDFLKAQALARLKTQSVHSTGKRGE
jgi:folate-dependent phosphoribosylglycinamide formyltransferase PurN